MPPLAIVTAADSNFFEYLQDLVRSIRHKPQGQAVPLYVLDIGLQGSDAAWLQQHQVAVVALPWPYDLPASGPQRGLVMRCWIPTLIPGHDVYFWIDADTWVQTWETVEFHRRTAEAGNSASRRRSTAPST